MDSSKTRRPGTQWVYRMAARLLAFVVVPLLFLGTLEGILRAVNYGHSSHVFLKRQFQGNTFYASNKLFFEPFFYQGPVEGVWDQIEAAIPLKKQEGAFRIFVVGSSAAQGRPPDSAFGFSRILDTMLRASCPGMRFEIFNLSYPCVNSNLLWAVVKESVQFHPDLYVFYMGNNEVNGPFGAVTAPARGPAWSLPLIRAKFYLADLRLAQLLASQSHRIWQGPDPGLQQPVAMDDPRMLNTIANFRTNLQDMCDYVTAAGARGILCTVGCNLRDWPPRVSQHRPSLANAERAEWETHYAEAQRLEATGASEEAVIAYNKALAIDDTYAELHFKLASCCWKLGKYEEARAHFLRAWETDFFHDRILPQANAIVGEVAAARANTGMQFVDAARVLLDQSPHAVSGREFFYDNVHMTFSGNYVLARSVFDSLTKVLTDRKQVSQNIPIPPSEQECSQRLGLSDAVLLDHLRVFQDLNTRWWHVPMDYLDQHAAELSGKLGSDAKHIAAAAYAEALSRQGSDAVLLSRHVQSLLDLGDYAAALPEAQRLAQEFPYRRDAHRLLGVALARTGAKEKAAEQFSIVLANYPDDGPSCTELSTLLEAQGRLEDAIKLCRRFPVRSPIFVDVICREAALLAKQGNLRSAEKTYRKAMDTNPKYFGCYDGLELLYQKRNVTERLALWRGIAEAYPNAEFAHVHLAMALEAAGDLDTATTAYRRAIELDRSDPAPYTNLAQIFMRKRDFSNAASTLRDALSAAPQATHLLPLLVQATCEAKDYAGAWDAVKRCQDLSLSLAPELVERLSRESGKSAGAANDKPPQ